MEARRELQAYLDSWRIDGPAKASQAYLTPDQHITNDAEGAHLASGNVRVVRAVETTPNGPRFKAKLELSFNGDPIAWGEGSNDRFVTFT